MGDNINANLLLRRQAIISKNSISSFQEIFCITKAYQRSFITNTGILNSQYDLVDSLPFPFQF